MFSQARAPRLSSLTCISLHLLCLLPLAVSTHIEIFSEAGCQNQTDSWNGPNGYPNGRCTSLLTDGNFTSFKIVNPDPGCAITLYAKDKTQDICSGSPEIGTPSTCFNTTWYYYSIDECFKPGGSSLTSSSASTSTSSSTSQPTTVHTHTRASSLATSTPVSHDHGPNIGAIVGGTIGGVAAGAALAAIGIISFLRYRRTKRAKEGRHRGGSAPPPYGPVEAAAKEAPMRSPGIWGSRAHEMGTEQVVELQTNYVHELPDSGGPGELGPKSPTATQGSGSPILGADGKR